MAKFQHLGFSDARGAPVPVRRMAGRGTGLALVLPGYRYTADMPLLAATHAVLRAHALDILLLDYDYHGKPEFGSLDDATKLDWLKADGRAYLAQAIDHFTADSLILAGKSLGTICMDGMDPPTQKTRHVWLTPSLPGTGLCERMPLKTGRHLTVIGTADPAIETVRASGYRNLPAMTVIEAEGMNHAWDHPDGPAAVQDRTEDVMAELDRWLATTLR